MFYHLKDQKQIVAVKGFKEKILDILPRDIYEAIGTVGDKSWEAVLSKKLVGVVKTQKAFGYKNSDQDSNTQKVSRNDASYF